MSSVNDTDKSDKMINDGVAQQSDSEIFFKGKLESDSGLTFSVKVELEGNNTGGGGGSDREGAVIDESQLTIGGSFGQVTLGAEDPASTLTHHGGLDVGITLNCGDTHKWIGGLAGCSHNGFGTYGHGHGDRNQIMYFSPRVSGIQFGASYIPIRSQEGSTLALNANETDAWAIGGNYVGDFGEGLNIAFSLGHYQGSQVGAEMTLFDGRARGALPTRTAAWHKNLAANVANIEMIRNGDKRQQTVDADGNLDGFQEDEDDNTVVIYEIDASDTNALTASEDVADATAALRNQSMELLKAQKSMAAQADDKTFSNVALQVGFGSFNFGVAYAANDGGAYMVGTRTTDEPGTPADAADDAEYQVLVEDQSKNWDTWGASVKYTDGPMAMSLSHLATEWGNGDEQDATMLSMSYTLAPGVSSKSSVFMAEKSTAKGRKIDGTGFVTGIVVGF